MPTQIEQLRAFCLGKGVSGIKALGVLFRGLDKDFSKHLNIHEFREGLQQFGFKATPAEAQSLFNALDRDSSGSIDFVEFLRELRPPMGQSRVNVINEVFEHLDFNRDGFLKTDDLKGEFRRHVTNHPRYIDGTWSEEKVLASFLATFDTPNDIDGIVTQEEFLCYYAGVSSTIEDDAYFDLMMRSCWGLPQKKK